MKGLVLISSGIDSPVAAYLMLKKKVELIFIHFDNQPFVDDKAIIKTKKLLKRLKRYSNKAFKLYIVPHGKNQAEVIRNCSRRYQCVLCRRFMFRISERIAAMEGCDFLVTGENLGQVASQTLDNLIVNHAAVKIPIMRPLLCNDKIETIKIAEDIGTYKISILPGMCCNMVPKHPVTKAFLWKVEEEEKKVNVNRLADESVKNSEVMSIQ